MEDGLTDVLQHCIPCPLLLSISINYLEDGIQNVLPKFTNDIELGEIKRMVGDSGKTSKLSFQTKRIIQMKNRPQFNQKSCRSPTSTHQLHQ